MGTALPAKTTPPPMPSFHIERRRATRALDEAVLRGLTTVVAGSGWGKTVTVAGWARRAGACWLTLHRDDNDHSRLVREILSALRVEHAGLPMDLAPGSPDSQAADLLRTLTERVGRSVVLVLDDLRELDPRSPATRLVEALSRAEPEILRLVLVSRTDLPFPVRRPGERGRVTELGTEHLAFDVREVARVLESAVPGDGGLAAEVWRLTSGWPAVVRHAADSLAARSPQGPEPALARLRRRGGPLLGHLAATIGAGETESLHRLLLHVAVLNRVTISLCGALGLDTAKDVLPLLAGHGLAEVADAPEALWSLIPPLRDALLADAALGVYDMGALHRRAADFHRSRAMYGEAIRHLVDAGEHEYLASLLAEHGTHLIASGEAEVVVQAATALHHNLDALRLRRVTEPALRARGDANGGGPLPPGVAVQLGLLWHLRGNLDQALRCYSRGVIGNGDTADEVLLLAWTATAHWALGDFEDARALADRALLGAQQCGNAGPLAASHTAAALLAAAEGNRRANAWHYASALGHAERAGNVLETVRIRANLSSHFLEEGRAAEAVREADLAVELAQTGSYDFFHALALVNRGGALIILGRFEEAAADFRSALDLYQRLGSAMVAYALVGLGDVYRELGEASRARAAYEEALRAAEESADLQSLGWALVGLARVRAADDLAAARDLAQRAVDLGHGLHRVQAMLARGWLALLAGDRARAAEDAAGAADLARGRRDLIGLAESLELTALTVATPAAQLALLGEASAIFQELLHPVGTARTALVQALLTGTDVESAEQGLHRYGVRATRVASSLAVLASSRPRIAVHALGSFKVLRDGVPVPAAEWKSKKARDLFKILIAREGRPVSREQLMTLLWPEEKNVTGNRLSVLLYAVRGVLANADEGPLIATRTTVQLQTDALDLDVRRFRGAADTALDAYQRGGPDAANLLGHAESLYGGDFLEEDADEGWAVPLREECRSAYLAVLRALADLSAAGGDFDQAVRHCLRLLSQDPFDEKTHLRLIQVLLTAGRYGEAMRRHQIYAQAMREIGMGSECVPWSELRDGEPGSRSAR
ncbi:tetratricopeptide repeat protein [Herbidospora sp. NEAU-GS84]|uniref:Tetratricopeptide repeat protein n=1 Tax=Herbidospora solisilvae TaxID=2696284 RepID=A0A7C9JGB9_9ACTN|nr:tetratricopeptide repeat protein [Herbidospora solisilvae]NAS25941.1 tetratricopeptide repeat protein [Herbidospora solisilvae]